MIIKRPTQLYFCSVLTLSLISGCIASSPQGLHKRSTNAIAAGKYEQGINTLNRLIKSQPEFAEAYVTRGIAYSETGRVKDAIADYQKAIELNPDLIEAYYNLGNAHMQLNAYEDAIASYSEVIARDSTYGPAYGNRGNAYNILQKPEKAIADLEAATQIFAEQGNTKAEQVSRLKLKELKQDLKTDPAHENSNDFTNSSAPP